MITLIGAMGLTALLRLSPSTEPLPLHPLSLSSNSIPENTLPGILVGALLGRSFGSTLILENDAGGRFVLSGNLIITGSGIGEVEADEQFEIIVLEKRNDEELRTTLTITVNNVVIVPPDEEEPDPLPIGKWTFDSTGTVLTVPRGTVGVTIDSLGVITLTQQGTEQPPDEEPLPVEEEPPTDPEVWVIDESGNITKVPQQPATEKVPTFDANGIILLE